MKNSKWIYLLCIMIFSTLFLKSCHKPEELYDLFPLKAGNEFFYSYSYNDYDPPFPGTKKIYGQKIWSILADSIKNNTIEYSFEELFNGIEISFKNPLNDTVYIVDSIRHFKIIEDRTGQLSFCNLNPTWNITLQRFQNDPDIKIHNWVGINYQRDYEFYANKGLINYINGKGPISGRYSEVYDLDSVKLNH